MRRGVYGRGVVRKGKARDSWPSCRRHGQVGGCNKMGKALQVFVMQEGATTHRKVCV